MTSINTLTLRDWKTPGIVNANDKGDFYTLYGLYVDPVTGYLRRCPAWIEYQQGPSTMRNLYAAFYDAEEDLYGLVIKADAGGGTYTLNVAAYNHDWELQSNTILAAGISALGGFTQQNVLITADYVFYIGPAAVYRIAKSALYTASPATTTVYASTGNILVQYADDIYLLTDDAVLVLDGDEFVAYYSSPGLGAVYAVPFRRYLCIFTRDANGEMAIMQLSITSSPDLSQIVNLTGNSVTNYGYNFAVHQGAIYYSPGPYHRGGSTVIDIYRFNGSYVELVDSITLNGGTSTGLIEFREQLLFYDIPGTTTVAAIIKVLSGKRFVEYAPVGVVKAFGPLYNIGQTLVFHNYVNTTNQGVNYTTSELMDGYVETSRHDMGQPHALKRLSTLSVSLSSAVANFSVALKYRVDDASAWTTAATGENTRLVSAFNIAAEFYSLQIRVELTDETGASQDIAITAISATYTIQ